MTTNPIIRKGLVSTKNYMVKEGVLKLTSEDELNYIAQEHGRPWTELSFRGSYRPESKQRQYNLSSRETITIPEWANPPTIGSEQVSTCFQTSQML